MKRTDNSNRRHKVTYLILSLILLSLALWGCDGSSSSGGSDSDENGGFTQVQMSVAHTPAARSDETLPIITGSAKVAVRITVTAADFAEPMVFEFTAEEIAANGGVVSMLVPTGPQRTFTPEVFEAFTTVNPNEFPGAFYEPITLSLSRTVDLRGEPVVLNIDMLSVPTVNLTGVMSDDRVGALQPLNVPCANPNVTAYFTSPFLNSSTLPIPVSIAPGGNYSISNVPVGYSLTMLANDGTTGAGGAGTVTTAIGASLLNLNLYGAAQLIINPSTFSVYATGTAAFSVSGGIPPYSMNFDATPSGIPSMAPMVGVASGQTVTYVAGAVGLVTDIIRATDNCADSRTANANVFWSPLVINPPGATVAPYDDQIFTASGGNGTYLWGFASQGCPASILIPSISVANEVNYNSNGANCTDVINLNDTDGTPFDTANVVAGAALQIAPVSTTVQTSTSTTFTASGGKPPYTFSIFADTSGGASVVAATGQYTAGPSAGASTVRVSDSAFTGGFLTPRTSDASVTVVPSGNLPPTWTTYQTLPIACPVGQAVTGQIGTATDSNLPNAAPGDPGYMTCTSLGTSCINFTPTIAGDFGGTVNCLIDFIAPTAESCTVDVEVLDGLGASSGTIIFSIIASNIIYVDVNNPGPTYDGTSWGTAFANIRQGVNAAVAGDVMFVADDIQTPPSTIGLPVVTMKDGVDMYGGFQGIAGEVSILNRGDPFVFKTRLDGSFNSALHTVVGANNAFFDGFTVTGGSADGANFYGGGMFNSGVSNLIINKCDFYSNYAIYGGGMANYNGSTNLTISNSILHDNHAAYYGGGMYNFGLPILDIYNCAFYNNYVDSDGGGGLANSYTSPMISNSSFTNNKCYSSSCYGGAIYNYSSDPTIANCIISDNYSEGEGGGIGNNNSSPTIINSIISTNSTIATPGALGGGMTNFGGSNPTITNCTFSLNYAFENGGAISTTSGPGTNIINCILWNNTNFGGPNQINPTGYDNVTYSDIEGGYGGLGNINNDPLFLAPGPVPPPDFHLNPGPPITSPCINTGDPGILNPDSSRSDMGAYGGPGAQP